MYSAAALMHYFLHRDQAHLLRCAAEKALSKIPVKTLKIEDNEVQDDDDCCAICIEPYEVSETLRSLPCRHEFHKDCIDPWLLENRTCPLCNMNIVKYYGLEATDSWESIPQLEVEEANSRAVSPAQNPHPLTPSTSNNSFEEAVSERSSASSPDELVPSLARTGDSPGHVSRSCTSSPSPRAETSGQEAASSSTQDSAGVSREP